MTQNVQNQEVAQEVKQNDKEYNFAQIRKQLEQERAARIQAEERISQVEKLAQERARPIDDDDDSSDDPYVDHKKLKKQFSQFEQRLEQKMEQKAEQKAKMYVEEERRNQWMKNNPDFYEVMGHAQKFAEKDPELAETILEMPDSFERQKLVYKNIKAFGLHKKEEPKSSIQETIDKKRSGSYYQPSGIGSAPYAAAGDFSPVGQKNAYDKMKELQARLRG